MDGNYQHKKKNRLAKRWSYLLGNMLMLPVRGERYVPLSFTNRFRYGCLKCTFSEATEHVKKVHVVLFFPNKMFQREICHLFVQWTSWIPASGFYRHLSGKWISFVQMIHMVRERNLPYIGFVFHLQTVSPPVCLAT